MNYKLYQTRHQEQRKLPGGLILSVLAVIIGGLAIALYYRPQASMTYDSSLVERVDSVNVRDLSVTIYWRTKLPTKGYVRYGLEPGKLDKEAFDSRDISTQPMTRRNHVVTLPHLPHSKKIYYQLAIDDALYGQSEGVPFMTQTMRPIKSPLDIEPLYGEVGRRGGYVEEGAVVIATIGKARPLLTQTHADGTFLFSPCCLYDVNSDEPLYPSKDDTVRIEIIAEDGTSKLIQSTLAPFSPLDDRILVDVKDDVNVVTDSSTASDKGSSKTQKPQVLAASDSLIKYNSVDVLYPQQNMAIPGTRPLIRGVGVPGQTIRGRFAPMNRLFQIVVDEDRNWLYQPSYDFSAGEHSLIIDTVDEKGKLVHITRAFSILKSGESVLGNATDSATLTPTATVTVTVTPSISVTVTPTAEVTATASPTVISLTPTPPVSGFDILPFTFISLVLIVIGGAIVLLF